jgi:hypothetical protein
MERDMELTREQKTNILMAQDIVYIKEDLGKKRPSKELPDEIRSMILQGQYAFIVSVLRGDDWEKYDELTDDEIDRCFEDRIQDIRQDPRSKEMRKLANILAGEPIQI